MATQERPQSHTLKDVMTRGVETIHPAAPIEEAAAKMKMLDVGAIPVCDGNRLEGILTDRDIVLRVIAEKRDPKSAKVHDAMTPDTTYCYEDQDVKEAAVLMQQKQIRRLPILNRENLLVGIVSLGDLAVKPGDKAPAEQTIEEVSEPAKPRR